MTCCVEDLDNLIVAHIADALEAFLDLVVGEVGDDGCEGDPRKGAGEAFVQGAVEVGDEGYDQVGAAVESVGPTLQPEEADLLRIEAGLSRPWNSPSSPSCWSFRRSSRRP